MDSGITLLATQLVGKGCCPLRGFMFTEMPSRMPGSCSFAVCCDLGRDLDNPGLRVEGVGGQAGLGGHV